MAVWPAKLAVEVPPPAWIGSLNPQSSGMLSQPLLPQANVPERHTPRLWQTDAAQLDVVQFATQILYAEEHEQVLQVNIMRIGNMRGEVRLNCFTVEGSAKAGVRYEALSCPLVFEDFEHTKIVEVRIIHDRCWTETMEFQLQLSDPDNCELGLYLHSCRVKIINNGFFPSNKYFMNGDFESNHIAEEKIKFISGVGLFSEFCKLALAAEDIYKCTWMMIIFGQLKNLSTCFMLYLNIYIVDVLFNMSSEAEARLIFSSRNTTAAVVGLAYVLPTFVLHAWDYQKSKNFDVSSLVCSFLQKQMFRRYLDYNEKSRAKVYASDIVLVIMQEAEELGDAFAGFVKMIVTATKLFVLSYFIIIQNPPAILPVVIMPCVLILFAILRATRTTEAAAALTKQTSKLIDVVEQTCAKYRLIADFRQRPQICDLFDGTLENWGNAGTDAGLTQLNNDYFAKWLGPIFIGLYITARGHRVFDGDVSLGEFLATINVFGTLSDEFTQAYVGLEQICNAIGSLRKVTLYLNLVTELIPRKAIHLDHLASTSEARANLLAQDAGTELSSVSTGKIRSDMIDIKVAGMSFHYKQGLPILNSVSVTVRQGSLVAIMGEHGSGKRTFLHLLGQVIFPESGTCFFPSHLRIIHVSQEPMLLKLSAWQNLVFGNPHAEPSQVKEILSLLGLPSVLACVEKDLENGQDSGDQRWQEMLTYAERAKVHLARALIVNSEVLVLQRPLHHYDAAVGWKILDVLKLHVKNRGLGLPARTANRRRPRTCFFIPENKAQAMEAEVVWRIDADTKDLKVGNLQSLKGTNEGQRRGACQIRKHEDSSAEKSRIHKMGQEFS